MQHSNTVKTRFLTSPAAFFFFTLFISVTAVLLRESDLFLLGSVPWLNPLFELAFTLCMCVSGGEAFLSLSVLSQCHFVSSLCRLWVPRLSASIDDIKILINNVITHSSCRLIVCISRKEQTILSPVNCWNLLLLQVKRESRDHATLSDLYLNNIIPRFAQISEDSGRLFKKVPCIYARIICI